MPDYFVKNGGDGSAPTTWAGAYGSLQTALTAASTKGDRVIIQYDAVPSTDSALAADTTYTVGADIQIIASTNSGTSTITPTVMDGSTAAQFIGNSSANRGITVLGGYEVYTYGVAFLVTGSTADAIVINGSDDGHFVLDQCKLWLKNTSNGSSARIILGVSGNIRNVLTELLNCNLWFGHINQGISLAGDVIMEGCSVNGSSAIPTTFINHIPASSGGGTVFANACDFSRLTGTLVADMTLKRVPVVFTHCQLGAGVSPLAAQTAGGNTGAEVWLYNCSSGDTHYHLAHHNALGSTVIETGIYANDNIADTNLSWKIVGTAVATVTHPYQSPWIDVYHTGTSAITPSLECVRSGSSTAYNNDQVWAEWSYQGTSGNPMAVLVNDRRDITAAAAAQDTGALNASGWTGENATSWFGKLCPTASFTPVEVGHIRARVCVGGENTVYVDPQIRGLS